MVVRKAQRIDVECIARGYITGSAWAEYRRSGAVNGQPMPPGLQESQAFPEPLFTPTTKAEAGHDMPLTLQELTNMLGAELVRRLQEATLAVYGWAHRFALGRGIILADTKFEFGLREGQLLLIDEAFTPDSSRFWRADVYQPGAPQESYDKQIIRNYLIALGWNRRPPAPHLPPAIITQAAARYQEIAAHLMGEHA
jgi:phosphoribosylaminoimidazole-succinocarboxamide synthase